MILLIAKPIKKRLMKTLLAIKNTSVSIIWRNGFQNMSVCVAACYAHNQKWNRRRLDLSRQCILPFAKKS